MLPKSLQDKLVGLDSRRNELEAQIAKAPQQWGDLAGEYGKLLAVTDKFRRWRELGGKIDELQSMDSESDGELAALARDESTVLAGEQQTLENELQELSSPQVAAEDVRHCFLEIRAAVGGNESCLFAAALFRMYSRFAESCGYRMEVISQSGGEIGGCKELIVRVLGNGAYGKLRRESGAHRVQRVPETESQGRLHTSVVTVAVLPEAETAEEDIASNDLRVETFRASGAGGQHVNTTDSAVRITHLPTGVVVECQDDRSQHKNRAHALSVLKARVAAQKRRQQQMEEASQRRALVGSGDRSDRIRTYNFPQGRMTDHRIGLSLYKLPAIMEGDLAEVVTALKIAEANGELTDA